jgi:hypothetical protein
MQTLSAATSLNGLWETADWGGLSLYWRRIPYSKANPIRFSRRQTTWQGLRMSSLSIPRVKRSGNQKGLFTSIAAPDEERLRTRQGMAPPLNSMVPALYTR